MTEISQKKMIALFEDIIFPWITNSLVAISFYAGAAIIHGNPSFVPFPKLFTFLFILLGLSYSVVVTIVYALKFSFLEFSQKRAYPIAFGIIAALLVVLVNVTSISTVNNIDSTTAAKQTKVAKAG